MDITKLSNLLDRAIENLLDPVLEMVEPESESGIIYALNQIPGLKICLIGCVDDLGEPEKNPKEVYVIADYSDFLRFGCNLVSTGEEWIIDQIFCRETKKEAYGMLEFLSTIIEESPEETLDDNIDVLISIADDEDIEEMYDNLILDDKDDNFDLLDVPDDYEETLNRMFEENEDSKREKNKELEYDFKPLYDL